jgi:hypothetical protein
LGIAECVQLGIKVFVRSIGKGQATALGRCKRRLSSFAFLYWIDTLANHFAGFAGLLAGL